MTKANKQEKREKNKLYAAYAEAEKEEEHPPIRSIHFSLFSVQGGSYPLNEVSRCSNDISIERISEMYVDFMKEVGYTTNEIQRGIRRDIKRRKKHYEP